MASCAVSSAISCISVPGGSYTWLGCYSDSGTATGYPLASGSVFSTASGSAVACMTGCQTGPDGSGDTPWLYGSIEGGICFCSSSLQTDPIADSASLCNLMCANDVTQLCGGFNGEAIFSEAYQYVAGGTCGSNYAFLVSVLHPSFTLFGVAFWPVLGVDIPKKHNTNSL